MLTSSSIAGACWLFKYAVSHCKWKNEEDYRKDQSDGTKGLRELLRHISQQLAQADPQNQIGHATVRFPSDGFEFPAAAIAPNLNMQTNIHRFAEHLRSDNQNNWIATNDEICQLIQLSRRLLGLENNGINVERAQDAKLAWLNAMLAQHPNDRFILFTESLQTCETLKRALDRKGVILQGSMSKSDRQNAVKSLRDPNGPVRVLVATSAADEGLDLQVASKVIHWDLSSSPATLMQRNGRAARLGQIQDVVAYYLILPGTHEERRDSSLQEKFVQLGIKDEAMKSRILGSLSEDEELKLEEAIEQNDDQVVGNILTKAQRDNDEMDEQLQNICRQLKPAQVLSRKDLAKRLACWKNIGLPNIASDITFDFQEIPWQKPVFGDTVEFQAATSQLATLTQAKGQNKQNQIVAFDPEFLLFGPGHPASPRLAGIAPWVNQPDKFGLHTIAPRRNVDLLANFLYKMARLKEADFLSLPAQVIGQDLLKGNQVKWLLFCTHPLREAENDQMISPRPFLTFYAFGELVDGTPAQPINPDGADAEAVHHFIERAEKYALNNQCNGFADSHTINSAKAAGQSIQQWLESVFKFGAIFPNPAQYFAPIPVCLIHVS